MNAPAPDELPPKTTPSDELEAWRTAFLNRMLGIGLSVAALAFAIQLGVGLRTGVYYAAANVGVAMVLLTIANAARRFPIHVRAIAVAVVPLQVYVAGIRRHAFHGPNNFLILCLGTLVLAALLDRRRARIAVATMWAIACIASFTLGMAPSLALDAVQYDTLQIGNWARILTIFAAIVLGGFFAHRALMDRLLAAVSTSESLLAEHRKARRRAQRALQDLRASRVELARVHKMDAIARFAGGISHEFNNALTVTLAAVQTCKTSHDRAELMHATSMVTLMCDRMSALNRQLLALARRAKADRRVFDVADWVRGSAQTIAQMSPDAIEVRIDVELANPASISADPNTLYGALLHVVDTYQAEMARGGGTVFLEVRSGDAAEVEIALQARARRGNDDSPDPTAPVRLPADAPGLGVARMLAESQGGELFLAPGGDAVVFRCRTVAEVVSTPPTSEAPSQGLRTLIVTPSLTRRARWATLLESSGATVRDAPDPDEARYQLQHGPVDLIVADPNSAASLERHLGRDPDVRTELVRVEDDADVEALARRTNDGRA